jgi:hypothetical protein
MNQIRRLQYIYAGNVPGHLTIVVYPKCGNFVADAGLKTVV